MINTMTVYVNDEELIRLVEGLRRRATKPNSKYRVYIRFLSHDDFKKPAIAEAQETRKAEAIAFLNGSDWASYPISRQVKEVASRYKVTERTAWRYAAQAKKLREK